MVICLFVGCMCSPCVRSRSLKTFCEPMGNSLVLLQAIRDLFPVWDVSAEQALRAWILRMPSLIRARLDALSLDELQQLSGASPPATATVYTQTVRLFMPRSSALSLTSFDTTEPQNSMFTSTEATSSTASILSVFGNAQASLSAPPRPSFAVATAQQPASQPCSAAPRPVFAASQPAPQSCSAAPRPVFAALQPCSVVLRPTFTASQPGLAAVRRSLVSQRSLVYAPLPTAELSPLSPAWAPQFLPGPALPTGPVAVLPPLPAEPAHPSPMSLEEEYLLLEVEEEQESTKL